MRTIVIKAGGSLGGNHGWTAGLAALREDGARIAIVHGGGPAIDREAARRGIAPEFRDGLRVTNPATLAVVRDVLWGELGPAWVAALEGLGIPAEGVDGAEVFVVRTRGGGSHGLVGDVVAVHTLAVRRAWARGRIPVVTPMGTAGTGSAMEGLHNVNGDAAAGALAAALQADSLVFLTDVPGVLVADDAPGSDARVLRRMTATQAREVLANGTATGGMIPKLEAALAALSGGVRAVHVGNAGDAKGSGDMAEDALDALLSGKTGTSIVGDGEAAGGQGGDGATGAAKDPFMPLFNRPLTLRHGVGSHVWDTEGRRYLDFVGGIAVLALGYGHPDVVRAVRRQAVSLLHTSNLYHTEPQDALARWLVDHSFADRVFFCNSGAEAVEAAIKLARRHFWLRGEKHRTGIIAFENGFHGRTYGALAATGEPHLKEGFGAFPEGFMHLPYNDGEALLAALKEHGKETAAVIAEPIQGEAGVIPADPAFLQLLRRACDEHGVLLILDEIQTGVGRTGHLWAHEGYGVVPDVMTSAKALGGGLPLGAVLATEEVAQAFGPGAHGSTFGGNPVACAAALATLQVVSDPAFLEQVKKSGDAFAKGLQALAAAHPDLVAGERGRGLMRALVLQPGAVRATDVTEACRKAGLLANPARPDAVRFLPPLNVRGEEIEAALAVLSDVLAAMGSASGGEVKAS